MAGGTRRSGLGKLSWSKLEQIQWPVKDYLPKGQSGIVTFGLKGGFDAAKKVADDTKIFSLLANIGDSKSLIIHPASTTHQQLNEASQKETGVTQDLVRLSVGLEDIEDLKADLKQAFK